MKDYQQASDDVAVIAEAIETIGILLDRYHARHGERFYEEVLRALPIASDLGGGAHKALEALSRSLIPPDDLYDRQRDDRLTDGAAR